MTGQSCIRGNLMIQPKFNNNKGFEKEREEEQKVSGPDKGDEKKGPEEALPVKS